MIAVKKSRSILKRLRREAVLLISACAALISMLFVPPSSAYASYIDLRVLVLLFCLMAVVAGFQRCGLFHVLAQRLLAGRRRMRLLSLALVLLPFFCSMLITNDVALITFVPFSVLVLSLIGRQRHLIWVVVLQTVAANLGSMATPVGNPQNLFLYEKFHIPPAAFFAATIPVVLISLALLALAALHIQDESLEVTFSAPAVLREPRLLAGYAVLFALCLLSVLHVLHYGVLFLIVTLFLLFFSRDVFRRVDYSLLLTFVCFFLFAGNIGRIESVRTALEGLMSAAPMLTPALASQVISNVPAAVLLSGFTDRWQELLLGVNIGGLGTPIASLASLISLRLYLRTEGARPLRYLGVFLAVNAVGLVVLLGAAALLF